MRVVKKLDPELTQLVQSTTTINSIEDIVKELIENSIDANSNNIQIIITHYKESLNIECIDNGDGISPNDLELVGDRFCTSKFQSTDLKNLQNVTTFGFRGEALNSILNICSTCIINSKTNDFRSHFQVMFNNDKRLSRPSISSSSFSHIVNNGTSILINDVFGNLPVRKLSLSKISWPQLSINLRSVLFKSFSFKPDCKFKLIYKTEQKTEFIKHSDNNNRNILTPKKLLLNKQGEINLKIIKLFSSIYGKNKFKKYESYKAIFKNFKINLIIFKELNQSKNYQFIFLNNRFLNNKELIKDINKLFMNINDNDNQYIEENNNNNQSKLFGKLYKSYPILLIFITCDLNFSELIQDSSKTIYETQNMKYIKPMIIKIINHYINTHLKFQDPVIKKPINNKTKDGSTTTILQSNEDQSNKKYTEAFILGSKSRISKIKEREIKGRISFEVKENSSDNNNNNDDIPKWNFKKFKSSLNKKESKSIEEEEEETLLNNEDNNQIVELEDNNFEIQCSQGKSETESQFFNNISKFNISINNSNTNIKILNQIDNKFILIKLSILTKDEFQNSQSLNYNYNHTVLALLDQHACDERIKLEKLIKNYIFDINNNINLIKNYEIIKPIEIVLTIEEIQLINNFKDSLLFWGIRFEILNNESDIDNDDDDDDDDDELIVRITHLPDFTHNRFLRNGKEFELRNGIRQYLFDILNQKKKKYLKVQDSNSDDSEDNSNGEWWLYIPHIPDMILEILKSKSCRSAVMFGDKLSIEECDRLIQQLRETRIPFRCAHGRPSIAPLIELEQNDGK
ncbi:hypothetical protein B5S31_g3756 [[Candida] boidinii]|nr:hypothetical protein B5S31_g3756 [[Candida] boidinii]